jgi:hypothetical protein
MRKTTFTPALLTVIVILLAVIALLLMGREPWCACGHIDLWGTINTSEGSQQLFDWYTPSHLLHGFIFFAILWLVARRMRVGWRLFIATVIEAAWEISENTPTVIEHYRTVTISLDYYGDSVLNSLSDMLAMVAGFMLARVLPVWLSVAIVIGFEVLTMVIIRDGLALNVIMLLWPLDLIRDWQAAL